MKKILCTSMSGTILLTQTASVTPWHWHRNELIQDSEIGFSGNIIVDFYFIIYASKLFHINEVEVLLKSLASKSFSFTNKKV